jgi:hypothetical protein
MGTTINPAVSGVGTRRWLLHIGVHIAAVALGASLLMALLRAAKSGLELALGTAAWPALAVTLIAVAVLRDVTERTPVPYLTGTQVPEWLRHMVPPTVTAAAYGLHLGLGFLTKYTYSTHMAFIVMLPLLATWQQGVAVCWVYALAKSTPVWASMTREQYATAEERIMFRMRSRRHGRLALRAGNVAVATMAATFLVMNFLGG